MSKSKSKSKKTTSKSISSGKTKQKAPAKTRRQASGLGGEHRRASARFEASMRVEYAHGNRKSFAFSVNVSQTGMLLRNASGLAMRQELEFFLALNDGEAPLQVRGRVIEMPKSGGVRVQFVGDNKHLVPRLKRFIGKTVIPTLEAEMKKSHCNPKHVAELANLYADAGKFDDAMELFRHQWKKRGPSVALAEGWVRLMGHRLGTETKPNAALLREMEVVSEAGLAMGSSTLLAAARGTVESLRSRMEREQKEHTKKAHEEEMSERVHKEVSKRMKDTLSKALESQKQEVEAQLARKLKAADEAERQAREAQKSLKGKAKNTEQLLAVEKARLESERESLESEMRAAQRGRKGVEKRERELEEMQGELASKTRELHTQKEQMAVRMRELKAMEEQQEKLLAREKKSQQMATKLDEERAALTVEQEQLAVEREAFNQVQNAVKAQKKGLTKLEETLAERAKELDRRATELAATAAANDARGAAMEAKMAKRKAELDAKAAAQESELDSKLTEKQAALEARFASRQAALETRLAEQNKGLLKDQQAALDAKYTAMESRLQEQSKETLREQQTALEQKQAMAEARLTQMERAAKDRIEDDRRELDSRAKRQAQLLADVEARAEMLTSRGDELNLQERDLETRKQRLEEQEHQFKSEQAVQDMRFRDLQQELLDRDGEVKRLNAALEELRRGQTLPSGARMQGSVSKKQAAVRADNPFEPEVTRMVAMPPAGGYGFEDERTRVDMRKPAAPLPTSNSKSAPHSGSVQSGFSSTIIKNTYSASGDFSDDYTRHVEPRIIEAVEVVDDETPKPGEPFRKR